MKKENYKPELFNVTKSIVGQRKVCKGGPHFAPEDGVCWFCRRNIYDPRFYKAGGYSQRTTFENCDYVSGITIEKASTQMITGCPHCNRSYVD